MIVGVSDDVLTDELWRRLALLLPPRPRRFHYPGRHLVDDRTVLAGIVWVLRHDMPWRQLPVSFPVSGVPCWRRLQDRQTAGVWQALHETLLADAVRRRPARPARRTRRLLPRARAQRGAATGPSPVNRGHLSSKHHLITDRGGVPLAVLVTGGNRHDVTQLLPLVEAIPPIRGCRGQPKQRPRYLLADRAYDHTSYRRQLAARGITAIIARRGIPHGSGLSRQR